MQKEDCWALMNATLAEKKKWMNCNSSALHLLRKILRGQKTEGGLELTLDSLGPFNTTSKNTDQYW